MRRKFSLLLLASLPLLSLLLILPTHAGAASGANWQAGRVIDDIVFTNKDALSAQQVQDFLNQKVGTSTYGTPGVCDTYGSKTSELGGGTRAQYGSAHNNPAPFTCLKDFYEVPKVDPGPGVPLNNYGGAPIPAGAQSAAQIIWDASQRYSINPRVLLVTIQKESVGPLITDDWPFKSQYTYAMGARCPDGPNGAQCNADYAGFSIQINESARLLRYYLNNMQQSWWTYKKPFQTNNILYNTTYTNCGGSDVYIASMATAALYTYTPYQPNQAALNNLYGTGDGCSAYGNRNFWRMYTDWFGTTYGSYTWSTNGYKIMDQTKTVQVDPGLLQPGQKYTAILSATNTGSAIWTNDGHNPVLLGSSNPNSRISSFCNGSWISCNRPAVLAEATVAPGGTGHFEFAFSAPYTPGTYRESFKPVAELLAWFNEYPPNDSFGITVVSPGSLTWDTGGYAIYDQTKTTRIDPGFLEPGQRYVARISGLNTGTATWKNDGPTPVVLGNRKLSIFCTPQWDSCNRPAHLVEASVAPGASGTFEFAFSAPYTIGYYRETFTPLVEFLSWFNDAPGAAFGVRVVSPGSFLWKTSGYQIMDEAKTQYLDPGFLQRNQRYVAIVAATNVGTATWKNGGPTPVNFAAPSGSSALCTNLWLVCHRPARLT